MRHPPEYGWFGSAPFVDQPEVVSWSSHAPNCKTQTHLPLETKYWFPPKTCMATGLHYTNLIPTEHRGKNCNCNQRIRGIPRKNSTNHHIHYMNSPGITCFEVSCSDCQELFSETKTVCNDFCIDLAMSPCHSSLLVVPPLSLSLSLSLS